MKESEETEEEEKKLKLIKFIEIRYADPISSLDLTDDYLLFGTMLGLTKYYIINKKEAKSLSEVQDEYISGVKISQNNFYICIGDLKVYRYNINNNENTNENVEQHSTSYNYKSESAHNEKCENCLTMLKNDYLIRTFIEFPSDPKEEPAKPKKTEVSTKNILNNLYRYEDNFENSDSDENSSDNNEIKFDIEMSNYCVPFDFDGKNFIFIDFLHENQRMFNIYDINKGEEEMIKFEIEKQPEEKIGHISHLKIIKDELLFIVRDYNICELRDFNLKLQKKLNIKSSEILAVDFLFDENNNEENSENNIINAKEENSVNNINKSKEKELLYIIILDLDCNIFLYNYKEDKSNLLFNLETEELGIDEDIKDQRFFSFGYPYYIKFTKKYIAISSDYGCILVQYS